MVTNQEVLEATARRMLRNGYTVRELVSMIEKAAKEVSRQPN